MNNPFTLSFGALPNQFISRPAQRDRILGDFLSERPSSNTYMITGVRGSGKTVMLSEISKRLREYDDWVTVELNPESDLMESLAAKLYNIEKVKPLFVKAKINISFGGSGVSFEAVNPGITSEVAVEKMLEVLGKHQKRLLVSVDEAVNNSYIRNFAHSFQIFIRNDHPVFLLMTGLYDNLYNLQNEKTLTFLYRAPKIILEPLNLSNIARSYENLFNIADSESVKMAKLTKGYPFAFQVLGYIRWQHKKIELEKLMTEYDQYLADYVYDKIWHEMTDTDKNVVLAICGADEYVRIRDLRETLDMSSSLFSSYREKLIRKGLVDVSKYGYIGLILPRFREYAIRMNEIESA